jgi:hypothetical protein
MHASKRSHICVVDCRRQGGSGSHPVNPCFLQKGKDRNAARLHATMSVLLQQQKAYDLQPSIQTLHHLGLDIGG